MPPALLRLPVDTATTVSARLDSPPNAAAIYAFAHGAGAGMAHAFMEDMSQALGRHGVAVLRFQVPFMERARTCPSTPTGPAAALAWVR